MDETNLLDALIEQKGEDWIIGYWETGEPVRLSMIARGPVVIVRRRPDDQPAGG